MSTLNVLSTIEDVLACSDSQLKGEIGALSKEVVTEYVFFLREQIKAKDHTIAVLKKEAHISEGILQSDMSVSSRPSSRSSSCASLSCGPAVDYSDSRGFKPGFQFPSLTVSLQGQHYGWHLSAQPNGTIECNRTNAFQWETIIIERHPENPYWIYLKSHHGKYLSAQPNMTLKWDRGWKRSWERFEVYTVNKDTIGLKSFHNRWVSAQKDGSVIADRTILNGWEHLRVKCIETESNTEPLAVAVVADSRGFKSGYEFPGSKICLQGHHKGWYVSAQANGKIECNRTKALGWEEVTIEYSTGDWIFLKSKHGKYLSAQPNGTLEWNRDGKGQWEQFEVYMVDREKIGLKSFHGKWVSAQKDGSVCADRAVLDKWEYFTVLRRRSLF